MKRAQRPLPSSSDLLGIAHEYDNVDLVYLRRRAGPDQERQRAFMAARRAATVLPLMVPGIVLRITSFELASCSNDHGALNYMIV